MTTVDAEAVAALMRRVADEFVMPRFRRLANHEIRDKGAGSLVTIADIEAEKALTPALAAMLPGSLVLGEEAAADNPTIFRHLDSNLPVWIIDPVDGTQNFANADPRFAVMVALVTGDRLDGGWILDPVRGVMAMAQAGTGAWLVDKDGNRTRARANPAKPLKQMRGTASGRLGERGRIHDLLRQSDRIGTLSSTKSAAQEYLGLVEDRIDYTMFGRRVQPWDHAAGILLYREAGGVSGFLDGGKAEVVPYTPRRHMGPLLSAPTPESWQDIHDLLIAP